MGVLITVGKGIIARELVNLFTTALGPSHHELEVADTRAVLEYFSNNTIDSTIHVPALTSVKVCKENKTKYTPGHSIKKIKEMFDKEIIKDYPSPVHSNHAKLFTDKSAQAKVYTRGAIPK